MQQSAPARLICRSWALRRGASLRLMRVCRSRPEFSPTDCDRHWFQTVTPWDSKPSGSSSKLGGRPVKLGASGRESEWGTGFLPLNYGIAAVGSPGDGPISLVCPGNSLNCAYRRMSPRRSGYKPHPDSELELCIAKTSPPAAPLLLKERFIHKLVKS